MRIFPNPIRYSLLLCVSRSFVDIAVINERFVITEPPPRYSRWVNYTQIFFILYSLIKCTAARKAIYKGNPINNIA